MKTFLSTCGLWFASLTIALGATQTVTTTSDNGDGSLRAAIMNASPGDTIAFAFSSPAKITLTSGELLIKKALTITGPGAELLTVQRSGAKSALHFPIFHLGPGHFAVMISGLTISKGDNDGVTGSGRGGGLDNESSGMVVLSGCIFSGNHAYQDGGGIEHDYGAGSLNLIDCIITGNSTTSGFGGGLDAGIGGGAVTLLNCTVSANRPGYGGGGIYNHTNRMVITESTISQNMLAADPNGGAADGGGIANDGTLTIVRSTISNNVNHRGNGGGIDNQGILTVSSSTIFGNTALQDGGGLFTTAQATISNSTFTKNTATQANPNFVPSDGGGGIATFASSTTTLLSTIVADNSSPTNPDVSGQPGSITSRAYNLVGIDSLGLITPRKGDLIGSLAIPIDPLLRSLGENGGPTKTCSLLTGSPAIDAGDPKAPAKDQRDYDRQGSPDIGALEQSGTIPKTLANISTRLYVGTGDDVLIGGFIVTGTHNKQVLLRAIGPSLSVNGKLANPTLELHDSSGAVIATNDDWQTNKNAQQIIDTGIPPPDPLESALLSTLKPGAYTVILRGVNNATGIALVEAYDLDRTTDSKLANISTRGFVKGGDNVMIGGFIVEGSEDEKVLLRAIGPSLPLPNALADPVLELHDADGDILATNDNWRSTQESEIEATGIPPIDDAESAIVATLAPGNYTAVVRGARAATGIGLVEAYGLN